jgi:enamine deaminase RidA (YjgF/YER057c/UK114 family)
MKAGRWVFATGLMAQDFKRGIAADVLSERLPHSGRPKREKEALRLFENLDAVLKAAGTDRSNLVRTDQYYTTVRAVPPYQQVRREFLSGRIPPSTSIAMHGLVLPGAEMNIQALAIVPGGGVEVTHLKSNQLAGRPTSGYSPALTAGDYIFIPGVTSYATGDEPKRNGVATAALMTEGMQWAGEPIKLETEFLITRRIAPSLLRVQRGLDAAFREVAAIAVDHAVPRTWPCALRRQDRDQCHGGEARQRRAEALHRCRHPDRVSQPAAGGAQRRSSHHVGRDGDRPRRPRRLGRGRSAPTALRLARATPGRDHHR